MRRITRPIGWIAGALALATLACSGFGPTPGPVPPDVAEPDEPDEPDDLRPDRSDCRARVVGVLTGLPGWGSATEAHGPLQLHAQPRSASEVVATIDRYGGASRTDPSESGFACRWFERDGDLPACLTVEVERGVYGVPVFARREKWALVAIGPGKSAFDDPDTSCRPRGWIRLQGAVTVLDLPETIDRATMPTTLPGWTGLLYDGPGGTPRPSGSDGAVPFRPGRMSVENGRAWIEATLTDDPCDPLAERGTGWIPLTDETDRLQVWFRTGC